MGKNIFDNLKKVDTSYLLDPTVIKEIEDTSVNIASADEIKDVDINMLVPFKNHPFNVDTESPKFKELVESIDEHGILQPVLVREHDGSYEIISGHCRTEAARILGLKQVPVKIVQLDDMMATVIMVHSNVYAREKISISEKVRAYRMCFDAEAAAGRSRTETASVIGAGKDSKRQVYRYVRLSHLTDELLDILDNSKITIDTGVELAYMNKVNQNTLYKVINEYNIFPSIDQAKAIRKEAEEATEALSCEAFISLLVGLPKPKVQNKVSFKTKELQEYFDDDTSAEEMTDVIKRLLEKYRLGEVEI